MKKDMIKKLVPFSLTALLLAPLLVGAQATGPGNTPTTGGPGTIEGVIGTIGGLLNTVVPILVALAFLYFIYGVAKLITAGGDTEKQGEGRSIMIYGIIALFVIVSVWGLVNILVQTFGTDTARKVTFPKLPPTR